MLKEYTSVPQKRLACKIVKRGKIAEEAKMPGMYTYKIKENGINHILRFSASEKPKVGGYIIKIAEDDIYFCKESVFEKGYKQSGFQLA